MVRMQRMRWTAAGVSVFTLLMGMGSAAAQGQTAAVAASSQETATRKQASEEPRGPQEGIKVHGDWTIVIRNPDGSVALRHEFKNALAVGFNADRLLAQFLAGDMVPGHWGILL